MIGRVSTLLARLRRDARGVTLLEFGLISPALILTIMAIGDLGYQSYLHAVARGVLEKAARAASVGTLTGAQFDAYIAQQMATITARNASPPKIVKKSYYNFSRVGKPEKITSDTAPLGTYNSGDCYEDANGNGSFDASAGGTGLGSRHGHRTANSSKLRVEATLRTRSSLINSTKQLLSQRSD